MSIAKQPCPGCGGPIHRGSPRCLKCMKAGYKAPSAPQNVDPLPETQVTADRQKSRSGAELAALKAKYAHALELLARYEERAEYTTLLNAGLDTFAIEPRKGSGTSEATAVALLSDWHSEEIVRPGQVSGLNEANPDIIKARVTRLFQGILRLTQLLQQDVTIDHMVLALLGDFITNQIHGAENAETNALQPIHAILNVQGMIVSGLKFLLANTRLTFVLPCHSGNHARTTIKTRFASENGHSLEYLMFKHLAEYFENEPRLQFVIPEGPHSYVRVYDQTIRFHHGHAVKYGGGVGGIFIPAYKAIAQWSKARPADLDCFGHFHQTKDGGNFLCNGSLIGYNSFALSIKADYEPPRQTLFLMDKKRGRTCTWPIILGDRT